MTTPMKELQNCDFTDHATGNRDCPLCETGYPRHCACADPGWIHAEIVYVEGDGYIQLTRCDKCALPG